MSSTFGRRFLSALDRWYSRRRTRAVLEALNDHLLNDIGIDRCNIDVIAEELCPVPKEEECRDAQAPLSARSYYY